MIDISENKQNKVLEEYVELSEAWKELSNLSNNFSMSANGRESNGVKPEDLLKYLQNPSEHLKQIRNTSTYLTNKHGILKDVIRMIKTLPTLKYSLRWSATSNKEIRKHEQTVKQFLRDIQVVKFIRDGLYETALLGTVIPILRKRKYIQFLEIEDVQINKQRNGKWVVEFDLSSLDSLKNMHEKVDKIKSLPSEVTLRKYNAYRNKRDDKNRFIELKDCEVVALDSFRNSPMGLPYTFGAWVSILQKEMIDQVERSISERLLTQILVLKASHFDKDGKRPVTDDVVTPYFKGISDMLKTKDSTARSGTNNINGSGLIQLPFFLELDALQMDATMFHKDLYDKIDDDIFSSLGVSKAIVYGEGGNYSSAQVNSEKLFSIIFSLVEQFEGVINNFIKTILPEDVVCEINFDKSTVLDKQTEINNYRELYMQTSYATPYFESVLNMSMEDILEQRKHEEKMGLGNYFYPAQNAYTSSGDNSGRPRKQDSEIDNDSTVKTRSNDGNSNPSPSD